MINLGLLNGYLIKTQALVLQWRHLLCLATFLALILFFPYSNSQSIVTLILISFMVLLYFTVTLKISKHRRWLKKELKSQQLVLLSSLQNQRVSCVENQLGAKTAWCIEHDKPQDLEQKTQQTQSLLLNMGSNFNFLGNKKQTQGYQEHPYFEMVKQFESSKEGVLMIDAQ